MLDDRVVYGHLIYRIKVNRQLNLTFSHYVELYTCYKLDASHTDIQVAIDRLTEWADLWQLQIATSKCSIFRIWNPQCRIRRPYNLYCVGGAVL